MIQRIQSIYLLLASVCSFALFKLPFASVQGTVSESALFSNDSIYNLNDNVGLLGIFVVTGIIALVAIFLFNNRVRQKLIATIAAYLNIAGVAFAFFLLYRDASAGVNYGFGFILTAVSIILTFLAVKAISNDQKLVSESDRLR